MVVKLTVTMLLWSLVLDLGPVAEGTDDLVLVPSSHAQNSPQHTGLRERITVETEPKGRISIYDEKNYEGNEMTTVLSTKCVNIHKKLRKRIESIDTNGYCVVLFHNRDCTGDGIIILRHSREAMHVVFNMGNNYPYSTRLCNEEDSQVTVFHPATGRNKPKWTFAVYRFPLSGKCVNFAKYVRRQAKYVGFVGPFGDLVIYNQEQCQGDPYRISPLSSPVRRSRFRSGQVAAAVDNLNLLYVDALPVLYANGEGQGTPTSKNATAGNDLHPNEVDLSTGPSPGSVNPDEEQEPDQKSPSNLPTGVNVVDRVVLTIRLEEAKGKIRKRRRAKMRREKSNES